MKQEKQQGLENINYKKLEFNHSKIEKDNIMDTLNYYPDFKNVFNINRDYTNELMSDLLKRIKGKIPRNFIISISGLQGSGKTTAGLLIAIATYPNFDSDKNLAFSNEELLDKVQKYSERGAVFIRDEINYSLRFRSQLEVDSIMETNREQQICFIVIGVPEQIPVSTHYALESVDWDINNEVSRFAIKHTKTRGYRGAFLIALPKDKTHKFYTEWDKYMKRKTEYQYKARERLISGFNPTEKAKEFMTKDVYAVCFKTRKKGGVSLDKSKIHVELFKAYPSLTNDERRMILTEIDTLYSQSVTTYNVIRKGVKNVGKK